MDNFGDILGGLGELFDIFGGDGEAEGALGAAGLFASGRRRGREPQVIVYERYLCGGPRQLGINDR